jgi:hypothetical protein
MLRSPPAAGAATPASTARSRVKKRGLIMSTFLFTLQVVCYAVSIVSASLSILRLARSLREIAAPLEDPN